MRFPERPVDSESSAIERSRGDFAVDRFDVTAHFLEKELVAFPLELGSGPDVERSFDDFGSGRGNLVSNVL
jgi:hypothetical protein